jgi:8-oxo-dGTP pyrophosphatase MutT (NUDIX family)
VSASRRPQPGSVSSGVRTAARAVILRGADILAVRIRVLPGGGQNHGETLRDTVRREVLEELGLKVVPQGLLYLREYVGKNHAMHRIHGHFHQVEAVFHCLCDDLTPIGEGRERDRRQVGFEWLPLARLADYPLSPKGLGEVIAKALRDGSATYLGDVH